MNPKSFQIRYAFLVGQFSQDSESRIIKDKTLSDNRSLKRIEPFAIIIIIPHTTTTNILTVIIEAEMQIIIIWLLLNKRFQLLENLKTSKIQQQQQQQPFNGRVSGTTRVGRYQKKHSPAHTHRGQRTSFSPFSSKTVTVYILAVKRTRTTLRDRSFAIAGPRVWNSLPATIRQITSYGHTHNHLTASFPGQPG